MRRRSVPSGLTVSTHAPALEWEALTLRSTLVAGLLAFVDGVRDESVARRTDGLGYAEGQRQQTRREDQAATPQCAPRDPSGARHRNVESFENPTGSQNSASIEAIVSGRARLGARGHGRRVLVWNVRGTRVSVRAQPAIESVIPHAFEVPKHPFGSLVAASP
jgi:hypothetical protein